MFCGFSVEAIARTRPPDDAFGALRCTIGQGRHEDPVRNVCRQDPKAVADQMDNVFGPFFSTPEVQGANIPTKGIMSQNAIDWESCCDSNSCSDWRRPGSEKMPTSVRARLSHLRAAVRWPPTTALISDVNLLLERRRFLAAKMTVVSGGPAYVSRTYDTRKQAQRSARCAASAETAPAPVRDHRRRRAALVLGRLPHLLGGCVPTGPWR